MLTNPLYAGHLEYPKWGVELTKAQHEPLISYSTFLIIQDRLKGRATAPVRKDISADFPLRGFLICEACGYPLTACWARGRSGKKNPYYLCQHRGCSDKGKSIPREELEQLFGDLLKKLVPTQQTFQLAENMFKAAWEERRLTVLSEKKEWLAKAKRLEKNIDSLIERLVQTSDERIQAAYEKRLAELHQERAIAEEAAASVALPDQSYEEMFEHAMVFLSNPYKIWENGQLQTK
ncbi:recombinase zinc beta ribbon domain-containing protein [Sagittula marina]|uniref:recombinase zinc beta ribbon domain-containing protein n=1 Tax=Sagittula marina TaxID=943940 RepID=UPI00160A1A2C|nr:recombinase zinc beta ribbon domain-containing protein [Sagittula marina]